MQSTIQSWRRPAMHKPLFGQELPPCPATRFFDQLSFIGTPNVGCFVLETTEGLILLDCMEPCEEHKQMIVKGFGDLGLNPADLKAILITHGHGDHYGTADWFREQYGCKIYMSKVDYEYAKRDTRNRSGVLKWEIYDFLEGGDIFTLGDTKIQCVSTPGHTPGGLSFIFPVTDEGRPHMAAMWGGSGLPYAISDKVKYLKSALVFAEATSQAGCDVEISTHPFLDKGTERLALVNAITDGIPNPFVLGKENYKYYEAMFLNMCLEALEKQAGELDQFLPPQPPLPGRKK